MKPETLRRRRRKVGMTQASLAWHLGISRRTLNRWERSGKPISKANAVAIAAVLKAFE